MHISRAILGVILSKFFEPAINSVWHGEPQYGGRDCSCDALGYIFEISVALFSGRSKKNKKNVAIGCESYFTFAHFFCSDFCQ